MRNLQFKNWSGMTLIETIIAVAIIAILGLAINQAFGVLFDVFGAGQIRHAAAALANQEFELIRNMAYDEIGTEGGSPPGFVNPFYTRVKHGITFNVSVVIRNIDDPFDGTIGGVPNDTSPGDYRLIEITLQCTQCSDTTPFVFTGRAAPRALENTSTNGSLLIRAIDASGVPVSGATVAVTNNRVSPAVNLTDTTDVSGTLKIIDLPPAVQSYHIVVSKSGYSTEQTYATSTANPNPTKPDVTVTLQAVFQSVFSIDRVSTLHVSSALETCAPVPNLTFNMTGTKIIGTNPVIPKFSQNYTTDALGAHTISNIEYDTYAFAPLSGSWFLRGTIPIAPLYVSPNSTQDLKLIMEPQNPDALLVTVKDFQTDLPLSDATVELTEGVSTVSLTTGQGFWRQSDWSGGAGQLLFADPTQYFDQDGNIETMNPSGELMLGQDGTGAYVTAGMLTSSVFDTGSASNFFTISWEPTAEPLAAGLDALKFRLASATTTNPAQWNYLGPDGTANTYYTSSGAAIAVVHNGDRYLRYRVYLSTADTTVTPNLSDVAITFGSTCVPPGQVLFSSLTNNTTYAISVSRAGYQYFSDVVTVSQPWDEFVVLMNP